MPYKDPYRKKVKNFLDSQSKKFFVQNLKELMPCCDCGVKHRFWTMQFDHVPEKGKKRFELSLCQENGWVSILLEILKCDLVCANCHTTRTHERNAWTEVQSFGQR